MLKSVITGSGHYLPERVIDGSYFNDAVFYDENGNKIEKSNEEIVKKFVEITEIETRRYITDDLLNSDIGTRAAEKAIEEAGIDRESIDYIIAASNFGEVTQNGMANFMPSVSGRIKNKLGIKNRRCVNYDMIFGCPGWVEGMILANDLIQAKRAKTILVVGTETLSRVVDPYDRDRLIFADGAGAVLIQAKEDTEEGFITSNTICDNDIELDYLSNGRSLNPEIGSDKIFIRMRGRKIYEYALKNVPDAIKDTIDQAGLSLDDIDKILIHQANAKMDHAIIHRLFKLYGKEYKEEIAPMTIQELGNSSVATVPTMYDMIKKGEMQGHTFKKGGYVAMASVGAGMNINCLIYKNE
ncbi:ketoacyl-ACP synthase III [Elizabethkingia meningoseptica]|uniref:3-oxoacyl-ACP synthase III family protein n=1 Tax=Elizabethkingia meningoseptica TaxID=238 RepID=UPI000841F044|nr:ketoacyl-ACP synthase III [Elizabethkingia meningoseptica]EJK5327222.1 ketoacyl-ACP synthase III [Elizabethkingia meningoseptica]MCL1676274.1 ketoacyl-ACP synthase III [Elizabethkingia meningoseptica]MCL1687748.1 ketoacyl-ACP synthase III [Elizabethkingia meningoseptica]MDE5429978.1 ketoacyl-ACP synthase III [Elizabethkingia meningoseptica]MDE5436914.1 ketoacyl-ACP synthase III [Elizabethkingia meningoseptica]